MSKDPLKEKIRKRLSYLKHRERTLREKKNYYIVNKPRIQKVKRLNYLKNRAAILRKTAATYRQNPEKYRALKRHYYLENKEKIRAYRKKNARKIRIWARNYALKNRARRRLQQREAYARDAQSMREKMQLYRESNRETVRATNRRCYRKDPASAFLAAHRRRALKLRGASKQELVKADRKIIKLKKPTHSFCPYCGKSKPTKKMEIEHIIPLAHGGRHIARNITLACYSCNREKRDKILHVEWTPPVSRK